MSEKGMIEDKIISMELCGQCKNYKYYDENLSLCELGRVKEFKEDGSLTECEYWEAKTI